MRDERQDNSNIHRRQNPDTQRTRNAVGIDGRRTAYFVFDNGQVYKGQTDGVVDEDGDFA